MASYNLSALIDHASPKFRTSSESDDVTSTPHTSYVKPDQMDLSAISSIASDHSVVGEKKRADHLGPSFCEPFRPEKVKETYTQAELDILYNSYIQWSYLEACYERRRKDDERNFMAQADVLFQENDRLRQECAKLDERIATAKYLKELDEMLGVLDASNVVKDLDQFTSDHTDLAQSLDTTRHQLPIEGLYIPTNTSEYAAMLTQVLGQSRQGVEDLNKDLAMEPKKLEDCVAAAGTLLRNVDEIYDNLLSTAELTEQVESLTIHESSLAVQKIMSKPEL